MNSIRATVYTTETCPSCVKLIAWLKSLNVVVKEVDATACKYTISSVPTTVIGNVTHVGFNKKALLKTIAALRGR